MANTEFYKFDSGELDLTRNITLVVAVLVLIFAIVLLFSYISNVAVFAFLESVLEEKIELPECFSRNLGKGLKFFLFNITLGLLALLVFLVLLLPAAGIYFGISGGIKYAALLIYLMMALVFFVVVIVLLAVVGGFNIDFIVPIMYKEKRGIVASWRELTNTIKKNKGQFLMYIIVRILLGLVTGVISFIVLIASIIALLIVAIIAGFILGFFGAIVLSPSSVKDIVKSPPILIAVGITLLVATIIISYVTTVITLPISVFYRYFSLLFLEKIRPDMKLFTGEKTQEQSKKELYVEVK
jgi:hypothetical protein